MRYHELIIFGFSDSSSVSECYWTSSSLNFQSIVVSDYSKSVSDIEIKGCVT